MRVVVAPDSMGGMLRAAEVADAIAQGWAQVAPRDHLAQVAMSDGGEGLLGVVRGPRGRDEVVEVAGPLGHPLDATFLVRPDGTAVIESAAACGLSHVPVGQRDPLRTTTYGVGQLLDAARRAGAHRLLVGLGGSATVDGGAGALTALGLAVTVADGSGLKIGGGDLHRIAAIGPGWASPAWRELEVVLLADVRTVLADAAEVFGPQKGASADGVAHLKGALGRWATVVARDLADDALATVAGSGAAGGLAFGLAAATRGRVVAGAAEVADLVGLDDHLAAADLVVTGEGRLDATSWQGKVVGEVTARARQAGLPVAIVAGEVVEHPDRETGVIFVEPAFAATREAARTAVVEAGARLARSVAGRVSAAE